ncbi:hypothetical protein L3Q82_015441, partial [Scortum barcoo]
MDQTMMRMRKTKVMRWIKHATAPTRRTRRTRYQEAFLQGEEGSVKEEDEEPVTSGFSPLSDERASHKCPRCPTSPAPDTAPANQSHRGLTTRGRFVLVSNSKITADSADAPLVEANGVLLLPSPAVVVEKCDTQTNGTSPPPSPRTTRGQKRKRAEIASGDSQNTKHIIIHDNETEIPLDMGVFTCGSPQQAESTRVDTPTQEIVSSSQSTPPPKKNK